MIDESSGCVTKASLLLPQYYTLVIICLVFCRLVYVSELMQHIICERHKALDLEPQNILYEYS